jgi:p-hydroxybenzoate 3-monooxygenase
MDTQVAIVGAGPAGLVLSHLLHLQGVSSIVIEARSRDYVENRLRAGVLEHATVDLFRKAGLAERMEREGLLHEGVNFRFADKTHRIDFRRLTGRAVMIYPQQDIVKDVIAKRLEERGEVLFDSEVFRAELETDRPRVHIRKDGEKDHIDCDFIAACDGAHGRCRSFAPAGALQILERHYPFGWLGVLAKAPPVSHELIYASHERGFALASMRSPEISRLYLQVPAHEDIGLWSDNRIWEELHKRFSSSDSTPLNEGPIVQKNITALRSAVTKPMQYKRMFLAGDAAHIVPPTGAKGLNLAVFDAVMLARALSLFYAEREEAALKNYSKACAPRIWKVQYFSWWMTSMFHRLESDEFDRNRQLAELDTIVHSQAGAKYLAENYVGLPFEDFFI